MISSNTELMLIVNSCAVAKCLTTNSAAGILRSMNTWITNCQRQNAYVCVLSLYVGMLFLFWIYGFWRSSANWASHLNLDEWTINIAMLNCFLIVNNKEQPLWQRSTIYLAIARSNLGSKMVKHSAIEIWSRICSETKNKTCSALFFGGV